MWTSFLSHCMLLPLSFLWQENMIQWHVDKPQGCLGIPLLGINQSCHFMLEVPPPDLHYDFITVHQVNYLALHTHKWMNQNKTWNSDPYLNPWNHHLLFQTWPWPSPHPLIPSYNSHNTRPRPQQLKPPDLLKWLLHDTEPQTPMNKWMIPWFPHNIMPVPPLPKWNPWDRAAPFKEECQHYYQAVIQYHYHTQGYLAHYPDLLVQLPDLPATLEVFTNKGVMSDLHAHLVKVCYLYGQGDLTVTICKQSVVDVTRPAGSHLKAAIKL